MDSATKEKWKIAYKKVMDKEYSILESKEDNRYYADPFILEGYIFFEDYNYKKGKISFYDIETRSITEGVLKEQHHLSFPHVFKHDNEYYMIPEEGAINQIRLFKAKDFPYDWEMIRVIKDGIHVGDTQIAFLEGKWHLFTTNANDNLLYYMTADDLLGEWKFEFEKEIPNSRPAGKIYTQGKRIIRPVQDCTNEYGEGVIYKEIRLNPYEEINEIKIKPWMDNLGGFHTINFDKDYIVVDGRFKND